MVILINLALLYSSLENYILVLLLPPLFFVSLGKKSLWMFVLSSGSDFHRFEFRVALPLNQVA